MCVRDTSVCTCVTQACVNHECSRSPWAVEIFWFMYGLYPLNAWQPHLFLFSALYSAQPPYPKGSCFTVTQPHTIKSISPADAADPGR